ncbi:uncharacterized protein METZ01_LOCUS237524 [marine metagenome]|uniref:Uncharacterized protein n=1 Tax=marine metagenome TaxID=408172 RepID=A0A382HBL1_9ZZZZ
MVLYHCASFPINFSSTDRLTLVVSFFSLRNAHRYFHYTILKVHPDRNQRESSFNDLSDQLPNLLPMQKQFPPAERFVLCVPAVTIRTDVHIVEEYFPILYTAVAVLEVNATLTNSLDLCPEQNDAGFKSIG